MDPLVVFTSVVPMAWKVYRRMRKIELEARLGDKEVEVTTTNLLASAKSLQLAGENHKILRLEKIDANLERSVEEQMLVLRTGEEQMVGLLSMLFDELQTIRSRLMLISMWKWNAIRPFVSWVQCQMEFSLLTLQLVNGTINLNIMAKKLAAEGIANFPFKPQMEMLEKEMKVYRRRIKEVEAAVLLLGESLPLAGEVFASKKYMRRSRTMVQTFVRSYTPPKISSEMLRLSKASATTSASRQTSSQSSGFSQPISLSSISSPPESPKSPRRASPPSSPPPARAPSRRASVHPRPGSSPSPASLKLPQKEDIRVVVDARHSNNVLAQYVSFNGKRPAKQVMCAVSSATSINVVSLYAVQGLDLSIEALESPDPEQVQFMSRDRPRGVVWPIVGKADCELGPSPDGGRVIRVLLYVVNGNLEPAMVLGRPFLDRQNRIGRRTQSNG